MAACGPPLPTLRPAARDPLARHPPAPDFFRLRRVLEVEDHHDVAAIAVEIGGEIRVASVEGEAMEALPLDEGDLAGALSVTQVPDTEAATKDARALGTGRRCVRNQHHHVHPPHPARIHDWRNPRLGEHS